MTATLNQQPGARYLSIARVCDKLSRKKTWLYDRVKEDPTFPRPLRLGGRQVFVEQEIDDWMSAQIDAAVAVRREKAVACEVAA